MGGYSSSSSGSPGGGGTKSQAKSYSKKNQKNAIAREIDRITGANEKGVLTESYSPKYGKYDAPGSLSDPREKDDTAAKAMQFKEQGVINMRNQEIKTPATALLGSIFEGGSRINRNFFKNEVLGKGGYKNLSVQDFEKKTATEQESIYADYFSSRNADKIDAYGNPLNRDRNSGQGQGIVLANKSGSTAANAQANAVANAPSGPTNIEMASADSVKDRILKINRKGRRATILNVPEEELTLGKKTLLG